MKQFFALLKVSVQCMLLSSTNVRGNNRKRAVSGVGAVLLIAFLGLYLSGLYSYLLLQVLAPVQMEVLVFVLMGMGALVGGLLFTTLAVKGVVFGGRDNDLLLSMPVSESRLMLSRVSAVYLENLLFCCFVILPAGAACALMSENVITGGLFWVRLLLAALALPLLGTALAVLLGALAAFLSAKVSRGALGQNIVMGIFFAAVFWGSFHLNDLLSGLAANAAGVKASLSWAAPMLWMAEGILGDWGRLLAFAACCVLPFALVVLGLGRVYRKAVTAFAARSARNDYKLSAQTASGQKKALLKKEARRFFGTPMYLWNAGIGLILLLAAGIAALVMKDELRGMLGMAEGFPALPMAAGGDGFLPVHLPHHRALGEFGGPESLDFARGPDSGKHPAVGQGELSAAAQPALHRGCRGLPDHRPRAAALAGGCFAGLFFVVCPVSGGVRDAHGPLLPQAGRGE